MRTPSPVRVDPVALAELVGAPPRSVPVLPEPGPPANGLNTLWRTPRRRIGRPTKVGADPLAAHGRLVWARLERGDDEHDFSLEVASGRFSWSSPRAPRVDGDGRVALLLRERDDEHRHDVEVLDAHGLVESLGRPVRDVLGLVVGDDVLRFARGYGPEALCALALADSRPPEMRAAALDELRSVGERAAVLAVARANAEDPSAALRAAAVCVLAARDALSTSDFEGRPAGWVMSAARLVAGDRPPQRWLAWRALASYCRIMESWRDKGALGLVCLPPHRASCRLPGWALGEPGHRCRRCAWSDRVARRAGWRCRGSRPGAFAGRASGR